MVFLNGHCKKVCGFRKVTVLCSVPTHAEGSELCQSAFMPAHIAVVQGTSGPARAHCAALGYCLGKKPIGVLSVSAAPALSLLPPAALLQTPVLFIEQMKFSSPFSTVLVSGLSRIEGGVLKLCLLLQRSAEGCSDLLLTHSSAGCSDSPLTAVQRFGDGTPSVLDFHLISYTTCLAVICQDSLKGY